MRYMRTLSICAAALAASVVTSAAADMQQKAPNSPPSAVDTSPWTGFYFGGHAGYAKIDTDPSFVNDFNGWVYGGHVGMDKQFGWLVAGIRGSITNYTNVKTNGFGCDCIVADFVGKLGFTPSKNTLIYAIAGGFWHNASIGGLPQLGWTVGGGAAYKPFDSHWTFFTEYQYRNLDVPNTALTVFAHEVKGGVSFQF